MADPKDLVWRVGHNIPRNLYEGDQDVGRMDTPELAQRVVTAMNTNGPRTALLELAARAEAVDLLERCRGVLRGTSRATRSWTVAGLLADLDAFLGPAEGGGGAVATEEKPTGAGGDGEVKVFTHG